MHGSKTIAEVEYSTNPLRQGHGLRFSRKLADGSGLLMKLPSYGRLSAAVDMFFVFYPLDIVWLDKSKRVVDIWRSAMPFAMKMPREKAIYVLEVNAGAAKGLKLRDRLSF